MNEPLLRDLVPAVHGVLVRRGPDFASAEDAVQDALVEAVRVWPLVTAPLPTPLVPVVERKVTAALMPLARGLDQAVLQAQADLENPAMAETISYVGKLLLGTVKPHDRISYAYSAGAGAEI